METLNIKNLIYSFIDYFSSKGLRAKEEGTFVVEYLMILLALFYFIIGFLPALPFIFMMGAMIATTKWFILKFRTL
tara:strand:+ start:1745 stop:1972 length:228 start_codon:yes stop_codon:yes gene_type:complete